MGDLVAEAIVNVLSEGHIKIYALLLILNPFERGNEDVWLFAGFDALANFFTRVDKLRVVGREVVQVEFCDDLALVSGVAHVSFVVLGVQEGL